jgi:hypothetical protein
MHFKVLLTVTDISVPDNTTIEFELKNPNSVKIQIKNPSKDYLEKSSNKSISFCEIYMSLEPNIRLLNIFKKLASNNTSSNKPNIAPSEPIYLGIKQELVPDIYAAYLNRIENDLINSGKNIVGLIRWMKNFNGPHNPYAIRGSYWSIDRVHWFRFPTKFKVFLIRQGETIHLGSSSKSKINELIEIGASEPLHHELFREAWVQRTSNPRSAMVIGITSIEVALYSLIEILFPKNKKLKTKFKRYPLYDFLDKYWCEISIGNTLFKTRSLPTILLSTIEEGVSERNKIAHFGFKAPETEKIERILNGIKDLLFIVDCLCGYEFTVSYISQETLNQLLLTKP